MVVYDVESFLRKAEIMIAIALKKPDIQKKLEACNYDMDKLMIGRQLLEGLIKLQKTYDIEYEKKNQFFDMLRKDQKYAFDAYLRHQKLVHQALKDSPGLEEALNLNKTIGTTADEGWLEQAHLFYKKVNFIDRDMSAFGLENAELSQSRAMIDALKDAKTLQRKIQKSAQEAIVQRDKVLNELKLWMYQFNSIAQIALHDDLHSLESMGIELES